MNNIEQFFKTLNMIFFALFSGQIIFFGVVYYMSLQNGALIPNAATDMVMLIQLLPIIGLLPIPAAYVLYSVQTKTAKMLPNNDQKLKAYQSSVIIKLALFEATCFIGLVGFLLTAADNFWAVFIAGLVFMLLNRPTKGKLVTDFGYSSDNE